MYRWVLVALAIGACASPPAKPLRAKGPSRFEATNASPRPLVARTSESVDVYTQSQPTRPFVEVGTWEDAGSYGGQLERIRDEAAVVGCDGVLVEEVIVPPLFRDPRRYNAPQTWHRVVCVVYSDVPPSYQPPPHPCTLWLDAVRAEQDPRRRQQRIRVTPGECFLMNRPRVRVMAVK
jgi:hypothetical protein